MAERTPLVRVGGYLKDLPAGDTVAGASGGSTPDPQYVGFLNGSGNPTETEFPDATWGFWNDGGDGTVDLVVNIGVGYNIRKITLVEY